jgi:hypothetical protein
MKLFAAIESGEEADSDLPSVRQVVYALALGALLLLVYAASPVWFHALAELALFSLGAALILLARQELVPQRHAFVPCAATGFFWAAALGILHLVLQEALLDIGRFPADAGLVLWLCARTVLALVLLLAPWCVSGTYFGRLLFPIFGSISILCVALASHGVFPAVVAEDGGFSPFRMAWEWMLVLPTRQFYAV